MIAPMAPHQALNWLQVSGPELVEFFRSRPARNHGWLKFLSRLEGWLVDPDETRIEDEDSPVSAEVIEAAINAAVSLYSIGAAPPTAVGPTSEGGIAFEFHVGDPDESWSVITLRFLPDSQIEFSTVRSSGAVTSGGSAHG